MFAGAAREAVFSNPNVIARISKDFIPVALKAGQVANPPGGIEGALYRNLKRTQPAPQGICVANSSGKVLAWSLMFEDDASVLGFLDHAVARYADFPDAAKPVATERFMRFPSNKMEDMADDGENPTIPDAHPEAEACPAEIRVSEGALSARVVGRAVDAEGKPLSDVRTQDNYIEDRFEITAPMQRAFEKAEKASEGGTFRVPAAIERLLASNAYLGQLDVNPLGGPATGGRATGEAIVLWGKRGEGSAVQIWGESNVSGQQADSGQQVDGRRWEHRVTLEWRGVVDLAEDGSFRSLALIAEGNENLRWGNPDHYPKGQNPVAHLPAGRPIDFEGAVWYGIGSGL